MGILRRTSRATLVLFSCWGVVSPGTAEAQGSSETIVVFRLTGEGEAGAFADLVTAALRSSAASVSGWELHPSDRPLADALADHSCESPSAECMERIAAELGASRVVYGSVTARPPETMVVSLSSYERGSGALGEPTVEPLAAAERSDEDLEGAAEALWARVAGPAFQPGAAFDSVDRAASYRYERDASAGTSPGGDRAERWPDGRVPLGVGLVAVGGALLLASVYSAVRVGELNDDGAYVGFRMHVPASRDVCNELDAGNTWGASDIEVERARSVCSEGRTLEVLTWVFLGGAILAGGAGAAVLLGLGARREREPRADLDVTPHGATIGATVPF